MTQTPYSYPPTGDHTLGEAPDESSTHLGAQAQQKVATAVDQAQGAAGQVAEQAKRQATSQLETQKNRAVDSLVTVAQALRQTGQHLHEQEQGGVAAYAEQAAERVEGVTNYLRSRDLPELMADTQEFARQRPALFLAGAMALGFIGARFLMSSGQRAMAAPPTGGYRGGLAGSIGSSNGLDD